MLLSGQSPFKFCQDHETQNAIIECDFDFDDADWSNRSEKCKNLIRRCLQRRPEDRPTASDLLTDDWLIIDSQTVPSKNGEFEKSSNSRRLSKRQSTTSILDEENSNISTSFENDNPNKKGRYSLTMTTEETVL